MTPAEALATICEEPERWQGPHAVAYRVLSLMVERMDRQTRGLAMQDCEFRGEPCYGCATCYARETVRLLDEGGR